MYGRVKAKSQSKLHGTVTAKENKKQRLNNEHYRYFTIPQNFNSTVKVRLSELGGTIKTKG